MKLAKLVSTLILFNILIGCNIDHSPRKNISVPHSINSTDLEHTDIQILQDLKINGKQTKQTIEELELLIQHSQNNNEFDSAIDALNIAKEELIIILDKISSFSPTDKAVRNMKINFEKFLISYTSGLKLQLSGIENGNSTKTKEGYQQTESLKNELQQLITTLNKKDT